MGLEAGSAESGATRYVSGSTADEAVAELMSLAAPASIDGCAGVGTADCARAEVERLLLVDGITFRNDSALCDGYYGAAPWALEDREPFNTFKIQYGDHLITLKGDDPRAMAEHFVDSHPTVKGGGCFDRACFVDRIATGIELDQLTTFAHPSNSYELSEALDDSEAPLAKLRRLFCAVTSLPSLRGDRPQGRESLSRSQAVSRAAPQVISCSGLGKYFHQKTGVDYEWKGIFAKTFGRKVHQLFIRDNSRRWYLGGVEGLGDSVIATARGLLALVAERRLRPQKIVCVGDSMGGFGALLFGALIGADLVLAFVPQTFSTPTLLDLHGDARWPDQRAAHDLAPSHSDLGDVWKAVQDRGCDTLAVVYFGEEKHDVVHAYHVADRSACVSLRQYRTPGGAVGEDGVVEKHTAFSRDLRDAGILTEVLQNAVPRAYWNASTSDASEAR